jgi:hypothetical protein
MLLQYAANIFGYGTAKDKIEGEECMVSSEWCNGRYG